MILISTRAFQAFPSVGQGLESDFDGMGHHAGAFGSEASPTLDPPPRLDQTDRDGGPKGFPGGGGTAKQEAAPRQDGT